MSDSPLDRQDGAPIEPAAGPDGRSGRAASVRLRENGDGDAAMMDPANQSLADALRITFVLVQAAMVVLAALFIFSGFQTIREGERGLSLLFGKQLRTNLEPGFHFSAPYPFGELVKVNTGNESVKLLGAFWPFAPEGRQEDSIDRISPSPTLDPTRDGSMITADLNIAHTQWQAVYRRTNPTDFIRNILEDEEADLVTAALRRGVVRTMATVTIDDLLRPQAGGTREISDRAMAIAQDTLDAVEAGITIEQFEMSRKTPPVFLLGKFQAVLDSRTQAQQSISEARTQRDTALNGAAGEAASGILWLISRYELMLEVGDSAGAASVLARIDSVLGGDPLELTEAELAQATGATGFPGLARSDGKQASGAVVEIIQGAAVDSSTRVQEARADLQMFLAKQEQFRVNPGLMVQRDWSNAWTQFQSNDFVQTFMLPVSANGEYEIWLNEDPDILKDLDRAFKQRQRSVAAEKRAAEMRGAQYQGDRGEVVEDK